jgi:hypothetical protein
MNMDWYRTNHIKIENNNFESKSVRLLTDKYVFILEDVSITGVTLSKLKFGLNNKDFTAFHDDKYDQEKKYANFIILSDENNEDDDKKSKWDKIRMIELSLPNVDMDSISEDVVNKAWGYLYYLFNTDNDRFNNLLYKENMDVLSSKEEKIKDAIEKKDYKTALNLVFKESNQSYYTTNEIKKILIQSYGCTISKSSGMSRVLEEMYDKKSSFKNQKGVLFGCEPIESKKAQCYTNIMNKYFKK